MPVKFDIFLKPAASWKITLESRNVFARLAKGSQEPPTCLWNFRLLSRSGRLLLEKLTHSFQIEASKHRPVGCLYLSLRGLLFPLSANSASCLGEKRFLEMYVFQFLVRFQICSLIVRILSKIRMRGEI